MISIRYLLLVVLVLGVQHLNARAANEKIKGATGLKNLEEINGILYYISDPSIKFSLKEGVRICNDMNMKLPTTDDPNKENDILNFLFLNGYNFTNFWLSGVRYTGETYIWSATGQLAGINNNNWATGQPDVPMDKQSCMYINVSHRHWYDFDCDSDVSGLICEE